MAVYTKFNKENIEEILSNYAIGKLNSFKGIQEGIENTNYFLLVDNKKYILTIYEKRVKSEDLPSEIKDHEAVAVEASLDWERGLAIWLKDLSKNKESDRDNNRMWVPNRNMAQLPPSIETCGLTNTPNAVEENNRIQSDLLDAFKKNPYTHSLNSVA